MSRLGSIAGFGRVTLLLAIVMQPGRAQDTTTQAPPAPPYVASVPDFFAWTMTRKVAADASAASTTAPPSGTAAASLPVTILKVVSTKTKDIKRDVIFYSNRVSSEVWYDRNYLFVQSANGELSFLQAGSDDAKVMVSEFSGKGFFGVDWITGRNFQAREKLANGQETYRYLGSLTLTTAHDPGAPALDSLGQPVTTSPSVIKIPVEALVAVDSHLPLTVTKGVDTFNYSYQPPPTEMLELPPQARQQISLIEQRSSFLQQLRNQAPH